jgi:phospholipase D-like protein
MSDAPKSRKRKFTDLSTAERAAVGAAGVVQVGLAAVALLDLRKRPARKIRGDKRLWVAASFVNYVGPIAYFTYGRKR